MTQTVVALVGIVVLVAMSLRANARFKSESRLPMQWSSRGSVNWAAPRLVALAFNPALAAIVLGVVVAATLTLTARAGQKGFEVPIVAFIALTFVAAHGLHLWLIAKTLRRRDC